MCKEYTACYPFPLWTLRALSSALSLRRKLFGWRRSIERRNPSHPLSEDPKECILFFSPLIQTLPVKYARKNDLPAKVNSHVPKLEIWKPSGNQWLVQLERPRSVMSGNFLAQMREFRYCISQWLSNLRKANSWRVTVPFCRMWNRTLIISELFNAIIRSGKQCY